MAVVEEDWPELSPSKGRHEQNFVNNNNDIEHDDWELLIESQDVPLTSPTGSVSFEKEAIRIDGHGTGLVAAPNPETESSQHILKHHYKSSPNLGRYVFDDSVDEEASGVLIGDFDGASLASSGTVWVSGQQSVTSWNSSKLSFRDAILQTSTSVDTGESGGEPKSGLEQAARIRKARKPQFVVTPIRRCSKSTGDLKSLFRIAEDDLDHHYGHDSFNNQIMGETDAQEFYSRKAVGKTAHQNGLKTRPDEAKRLQMSMAKKNEQRQRQHASSSASSSTKLKR